MIVVDCTVLADWAFGTESRKRASMALMETDPIWTAPMLIQYELGNVAWKTCQFDSSWKPDLVRQTLESASKLIHKYITDINPKDIFEIAMDLGTTYYDATYIWLAQTLDTQLYTRDRKLANKSKGIATLTGV